VLADYHLRVGEVTTVVGRFADRRVGWLRQDETEVGAAKALTIIDLAAADSAGLEDLLAGAQPRSREIFDHLSTPGRTAVLLGWTSVGEAFVARTRGRISPASALYAIRVIRDYGLRIAEKHRSFSADWEQMVTIDEAPAQ